MAESQRSGWDERERGIEAELWARRAASSDGAGEDLRELEPGWRAARSLMQLRSDALLSIMLRPSFRPVRDLELVPLAPCPFCGDGGLRTAGTVRGRRGRELVRACDTCGAVKLGDRPTPEVH
jgi:hypothetical protein